jgi:hypothetical protein
MPIEGGQLPHTCNVDEQKGQVVHLQSDGQHVAPPQKSPLNNPAVLDPSVPYPPRGGVRVGGTVEYSRKEARDSLFGILPRGDVYPYVQVGTD